MDLQTNNLTVTAEKVHGEVCAAVVCSDLRIFKSQDVECSRAALHDENASPSNARHKSVSSHVADKMCSMCEFACTVLIICSCNIF